MKLKTIDVNGTTYAEVSDGKPVFVGDDGKDVAFDAAHTVTTITRLNGEAKSHRERAEKAEATLKGFEGIEDAAAARQALDTVKNLSAGDLVKADKVEEIKREARLAAEKQVSDAARASGEELKKLTGERDSYRDALFSEKVGGAFSRSKFIADKSAVPADMLQALFGGRFKVEEGNVVGHDPSGNKIYSRSKPGEIAGFEEALEQMVDAYAYRDNILKGSNSSGSGAQHSRNGNGAGGKTMTQAQFDALSPMDQAKAMSGKDRPAIVG
jgi:hypothetical protein